MFVKYDRLHNKCFPKYYFFRVHVFAIITRDPGRLILEHWQNGESIPYW